MILKCALGSSHIYPVVLGLQETMSIAVRWTPLLVVTATPLVVMVVAHVSTTHVSHHPPEQSGLHASAA